MTDYHRLKIDVQKLEEISNKVEDFFHVAFPVAKKDDIKGMHYFREAVALSNSTDAIARELKEAVVILELKMQRMISQIALWDMEGEDLPMQVREAQKRIKHFDKRIKELQKK